MFFWIGFFEEHARDTWILAMIPGMAFLVASAKRAYPETVSRADPASFPALIGAEVRNARLRNGHESRRFSPTAV